LSHFGYLSFFGLGVGPDQEAERPLLGVMRASTAGYMIMYEEGRIQCDDMHDCMVLSCHNRGYRGITLLSLCASSLVLLSRRFILTHLIYTHLHNHNASIGPPLYLGIRPCYHSRLFLYVIPLLLFPEIKRHSHEVTANQ
jgi:hypothetical protein